MKEGWKYKKLGDVATIINGFAFKSSLFTKEGEKILRISNIQNDIVDLSDVVFFNKETYKQNLDKYKVHPDDILIALSGATTGKIGINKTNETLYLNQRVAICRESVKTLNHKYLYCFLKTKSLEFLKDAEGVAQPNLSTEQMKNYVLPIPPLSEQQHIVEELDLLCTIIEKKKAQIKELDNLAQSLFYEMFGDPIINNMEWEVKTLKELVYIGLGFTHTPQYVEKGVPFISVKDISSGYIDLSKIKYVSKEEYDNAPKGAKPQKGDLMFCRVGTMGKPLIVETDMQFCTFVSVGYMRRLQNNIDMSFLKYWMLSNSFDKQVEANVRGLAIKNLNTGWLKNFSIYLPPLSIQQQFAEKVEAIEHQKKLIKQSIKEVETLFNSRMDYYFN